MTEPYTAAELDAIEQRGQVPVVRALIATVRAAWAERDNALRELVSSDAERFKRITGEYEATIATLEAEVARLRGMVRSAINGLGAPNYGGRERRALAERLQDALAAHGEREEAGR